MKSRWARTTTLCLLTVWCVYPARECVVQTFQLANNGHFMIGIQFVVFCLSSYKPKWRRLCGARPRGIRVSTFYLPETSWDSDSGRDLNQGGMRWQASWMLQNSEPETFAAVRACKRAKRVTTQVLPKASFAIKQERSECSDDRCCDWCHSLPASLVHPSETWFFRP